MYLPSGQFAAMLAAFFVSSGLIYAAEKADPQLNPPPVAQIAVSQAGIQDLSSVNPDWQQSFAGDAIPQQMADIENQAAQLSAAVQGKNLTDSVGKSLLINLTAAQQQGLGADTQTQNQIVSQALAMAGSATPSALSYNQKDLVVVADIPQNYRTYGNALPSIIASHTLANDNSTLLAVAMAVDNNTQSPLLRLGAIAKDYQSLAIDVVRQPVPSLLAGASLQLANNYAQMAAASINMQSVLSDPLKGLLALQSYTQADQQNLQLFIQINNTFKNDGIVFSSKEPGAAWETFAVAAQTAAQQAAAASASSNALGSSDSSSAPPLNSLSP